MMNTLTSQRVWNKPFFPIPHSPFPFPIGKSFFQCFSISFQEFSTRHLYLHIKDADLNIYHFNSFQVPLQKHLFFICMCFHVTSFLQQQKLVVGHWYSCCGYQQLEQSLYLDNRLSIVRSKQKRKRTLLLIIKVEGGQACPGSTNWMHPPRDLNL